MEAERRGDTDYHKAMAAMLDAVWNGKCFVKIVPATGLAPSRVLFFDRDGREIEEPVTKRKLYYEDIRDNFLSRSRNAFAKPR